MSKQDMSKECGFKEMEMFYKHYNGEITVEELDEYYNNNCMKCIYMYEICMYGAESNIEVEYSDLNDLDDVMEEVRDKAKKNLMNAGIIDENGELAEPYR